MMIHDITEQVGKHKARKRVGRGRASGLGKTSGRGHKGAGSRAGYKRRAYFEGGQMTYARRIPKRGFTNARFKREWSFVNLNDLNAFEDGAVVTPEECLKRGVIPKIRDGLKVLGVGSLEKKLTVKAHRASKKATEAIAASDRLLEQGIYADVIVVTSADLLLGRFAMRDGYRQLKQVLADALVGRP